MKVGIDTLGCNHGKSESGIYLRSLVAKLKNSDDLQFELFGSETDQYTYENDADFKYSGFKISNDFEKQFLWHKYCYNFFAWKKKYDIVLFPAAEKMLPQNFRVPGVAIVNSLFSDITKKEDPHYGAILKSLSCARKIIVASSHVKKDLERLGVDGEKTAIVHNGIDHSLFFPHEISLETRDEIEPFAIQSPYFVYISNMTSRTKHHKELVKAFSIFKERTKFPHRLVLAGDEGATTAEVLEEIRASAFMNDIFVTGFFPHESFPALYSYSEGCVFPSENEGVGIQILEAMATGIPVACASSGALPEVAGNNALFFDAKDLDDMANAMERLACDSEMRKTLIDEGIVWAKRFSWEKTANLTQEILRKL